jgi:hypothetical protein
MSAFRLPVDESVVDILGIIHALEMEAGAEFSNYLDEAFTAAGNPEWFEDIRHYRKSMNEPFTYRNQSDFRFILSEGTRDDSSFSGIMPNNIAKWVTSAKRLLDKLHHFHHSQLKPDIQNLRIVAGLYADVTAGTGFDVTNWANALFSRTKAILDGTYVSTDTAPISISSIPEVPVQIVEEYQEAIEEVRQRPPLGSRWEGQKPRRKLSLNRQTRDLYEDGVSVSEELGDLRGGVLATWFRYFPLGGEVWVDPDGAAMGYIKGDARMIGWFGETPEDNSDRVRGFVLPTEYNYENGEVVDVESGLKLSSNTTEPVKDLLKGLSTAIDEATKLNITDYGDIFVPVTEGKPKRIANAHKGIWFKGQLPG